MEGPKMLMRVLTMRVAPGRFEDWKRYTKEVGFPGMLRQPGCRKIYRMRRRGADADAYDVVTWWDSAEDLDRFKASSAIRELSASAAALTIPPYTETLYDIVPD
ncbi:MAG TPA: antibiotic biosynthesis monooxygenase [Acetobacteraceae bacterium]|nr:antibiotic biosynthesis monooxygenase [Acetobacteraceae bacterium]